MPVRQFKAPSCSKAIFLHTAKKSRSLMLADQGTRIADGKNGRIKGP